MAKASEEGACSSFCISWRLLHYLRHLLHRLKQMGGFSGLSCSQRLGSPAVAKAIVP